MHLVVRAPHKNLARFVGYFKARVATSLNLLLGRCGNIWQRRYDAQAILSEADATERGRYTLANPQKAGLVHHIDDWPGFVAVAGRTSDCEQVAEWLDWSAWHRACCPKDRTPFRRTTAFRLHKLPSHAQRADEDYLSDLLADLTPLSDGKRVLGGGDKVLDIDARPQRPKRTRRPAEQKVRALFLDASESVRSTRCVRAVPGAPGARRAG